MGHITSLFVVIVPILVVAYFLALASPELLYSPTPVLLKSIKGGSWLGHRLSYVGALLILIAQLYSILKRLPIAPRRLVRAWLRIHIILGIVGSLLIFVHSGLPFSFKYLNPIKYISLFSGLPAGLVGTAGLATWFLLVCLISGIVGRYLYPRSHVKKVFRYWRRAHLVFAICLFITLVIHLTLVVLLRFRTT